ncbi:MAG: adenine phosphoribosyltransferase [Candidatus Nitrosoabyssus spongiisocia]|nr:MAG: adenine phosphoribosyltransferase [Nitrosopumilaceae archaeon AB1(1)]
MNLKEKIADYPDFPKKGIIFRDINPLLANPQSLSNIADEISKLFSKDSFDLLAGIESRGFIIASLLSAKYGKGMIMIRKPGKLPGDKSSISYTTEYSTDTLEIQNSIVSGKRILLCDDLLATGGTAKAACQLIEKVNGIVAGIVFVVELEGLKGSELLNNYKMESLVKY